VKNKQSVKLPINYNWQKEKKEKIMRTQRTGRGNSSNNNGKENQGTQLNVYCGSVFNTQWKTACVEGNEVFNLERQVLAESNDTKLLQEYVELCCSIQSFKEILEAGKTIDVLAKGNKDARELAKRIADLVKMDEFSFVSQLSVVRKAKKLARMVREYGRKRTEEALAEAGRILLEVEKAIFGGGNYKKSSRLQGWLRQARKSAGGYTSRRFEMRILQIVNSNPGDTFLSVKETFQEMQKLESEVLAAIELGKKKQEQEQLEPAFA